MVLLSEGRIITMNDAAEALELGHNPEKGASKKIDTEQIEGLLSEGKSYAEIAELPGSAALLYGDTGARKVKYVSNQSGRN